jgi:hypothetical protein
VARALDPSVAESDVNKAALDACRLIQKHDLLAVLGFGGALDIAPKSDIFSEPERILDIDLKPDLPWPDHNPEHLLRLQSLVDETCPACGKPRNPPAPKSKRKARRT